MDILTLKKAQKYADNLVITPGKTTFAKDKIIPTTRVLGAVTGSPIDVGAFRYRENAESFIASIITGVTYTFYRRGGNRFRLATFSDYPEDGDPPNRYVSFQPDDLDVFTFTALENEKYAVLYVSSDTENASADVVTLYEGDTVDDSVEINLRDNSVTGDKIVNGTISPDKTTFAKSNNLFDGTYIRGNISGPEGDLGRFRVRQNALSACIEIEGGETYTISRSSESVNNRFRIGTSSIEPSDNTDVYINAIADSSYTHTITTDINDRYLIVTVAFGNTVEPFEFKIEKGEKATPYDAVSINLINEPTTTGKKYFISDKPSGTYSIDPPDFNPPNHYDYNILIGIYDNLVQDYPEYVSRVFLANDESGLPLYRYDFKPIKPINAKKYMKLILTVTHGHEVQATYGLAYFLDDLTRNWENDDRLQMIRNNIELIVVPQCNPYGFDNGQRPTLNGVDINRNYPSGWYYNDDVPAGYGTHGPEPLSEVGSQVMYNLLRENQDVDFVIDVHNSGGDPYSESGTPLMWVRGTSDISVDIANAHINVMALKARLDGYVPLDKRLGELRGITAPFGSFISEVQGQGLNGVILEQMNTLNGSMYDDNIFKFNIESIGNMILTTIRYFS